MAFRRVCSADELWNGELRVVTVDARSVLLVKLEDVVYAYEDRCAHKGVPLSGGCLRGPALTCSAHEWVYDMTTGTGINPEGVRLRAFPLKLEDGAIWINVDES